MQIIVLGPHRSGTSLVTRLINMMGAYCFPEGVSIGSSEENPKGFWERRDVLEANDEVLKSVGASWDDPISWDIEKIPEEAKKKFQRRLKNIILDLDAHRPWVLKDPRLCLTFKLLRPLLEVPVLVYVYRSPLEVAASLKKRNGFSLSYGIALWEFYAIHALLGGKDLPAVHICYRDFIFSPVEAVQSLYNQLRDLGVKGLRLPNDREITAFVDKNLWRQRFQDGDRHLTPYQKVVAEAFRGEYPLPEYLEPSSLTLDILAEKHRYREQEYQLNRLYKDYKDLKEQLCVLQREKERWVEEKERFQDNLSRLQQIKEQLERQLAQLQHNYHKLRESWEKDQQEKKIFINENRKLQGSLTEAKSLISSLQKEKMDLCYNIHDLQQKYNSINKRNYKIMKAVKWIVRKKKEIRSERNKLQEQLKNLELLVQPCFDILGGQNYQNITLFDKMTFISRHIGSLARQRDLLRQDIHFLENIILSYHQIINSIFSSISWKISIKIANIIGKVLMKPASRIHEDAARLHQQFRHWRQTHG